MAEYVAFLRRAWQKIMKGRMLSNLPKEVKTLIRYGVYGLYSIKSSDQFVLHIPAGSPCCGDPSIKEELHILDLNGDIVKSVSSWSEIEVNEVVYLTEENE